jgi:D-psicose/D-tagatose/L-ribulose 3-epimerase
VCRYVHIGESHRGYLGTGSVDFDGLFLALARRNFAGPIVFESFSSAVVSKDLSNTLCVWRNLWEDGADLAQHARQYIDTQLRSCQQGLSYCK